MDDLADWTQRLEALRARVRSLTATNVNGDADRGAARTLVQDWFRRVRPTVAVEGVDLALLAAIDSRLQSVLRLAGGRNRRSSYLTELNAIRKAMTPLEIERELALGHQVLAPTSPPAGLTAIESRIISTLDQLVPSAALAYEQSIRDLADPDRLSFRGPANELRSALWEVLERLAPDDAVISQTGFKLEAGKTQPTQKQRVRYILRSRAIPTTARKAPEATVELIEELVGTLARATYDRSSISAHLDRSRAEVSQVKMYVDSILGELLEIHAH
jgi:hypothetical protein